MKPIIEKVINDINSYPGPRYAELNQDIMVLSILDWKKNGFFVEFGAMDGISYSNTYLLEKEFQWRGILCEPNKLFKDKIVANRKCLIDYRAVTDKSNESLLFKETHEHIGMSGLVDFIYDDMHSGRRKNSPGSEYTVDTVSLNDLLEEHQSPTEIDYVSMDTEGNEVTILEKFNFQKYTVGVFTIEHNFHINNRQKIQEIMKQNGYHHILSFKSQYDDWFINSKIWDQ